MEQLSLGITPQIIYRPEGFILHQGVKGVADEVLNRLKRHDFSFSFIFGPARFGKTHLAVYLAQQCSDLGYFPRMIGVGEFEALVRCQLSGLDSDSIFIIDDADKYLAALKPGESGPCVNFLEQIRLSHGKVVFLSKLPLNELHFDDHIRSRLAAGSGYEITAPGEAELPSLIDAMARQRGFKFSEKKQEFLERRLSRDIAALEDYIERVVHLSNVLGKRVGFALLGDAL